MFTDLQALPRYHQTEKCFIQKCDQGQVIHDYMRETHTTCLHHSVCYKFVQISETGKVINNSLRNMQSYD